jgi:hypothetical protein
MNIFSIVYPSGTFLIAKMELLGWNKLYFELEQMKMNSMRIKLFIKAVSMFFLQVQHVIVARYQV